MKHKCPNYSELFLDVLNALDSLGGSASIEEICHKVIEDRNFSNEIVDELHTGSTVTTELEYQLAWARTYLRKSGLVDRSRNGVWILTKAGMEICATGKIDKRGIIKKANADGVSHNENQDGLQFLPWKERLSAVLHKMNPFVFEKLAQLLLRECGFMDVVVTRKTGDGGIDGTGKLRLNGIFSFNVAFQCKRYRGQVCSRDVRDFRGSLDQNIEKGVLITTGTFTKQAREEASAPGKRQIDLMDGNDFMEKLAECGIGLIARTEYEIDDKFFSNLEAP